jgi:hypothetical protein
MMFYIEVKENRLGKDIGRNCFDSLTTTTSSESGTKMAVFWGKA